MDEAKQKRKRNGEGGIKMISDTLFDAREDIEKYLQDPEIEELYEDYFFEIKEIMHRMEMLQLKLDRDNK